MQFVQQKGLKARLGAGLGCWLVGTMMLAALSLQAADLFEEVTVNNRFFKSRESHPAIKARLAQSAAVYALIYDWDGRLVASEPSAAATRHEWSVKDLPAAKNGVYMFCLAAVDDQGKRLDLYPPSPDGGEVIKIANARLNAGRQQVEYQLPRAACVRVRAGFPEGPYLTPVLPWTPQPAGYHEASWDGTSAGGSFRNLYQNPRTQVIVSAVTLPQNVLVDMNPVLPAATNPDGASLPQAASLADLKQYPWPAMSQTLEKHAEMAVSSDFQLTMESPHDPAAQTIIIQVNCAPADRARIMNRRYEIMLFLDAFFVMEDERGLLPFNYRMSTRGIAPGRHILTVNVIDSDGRLGAVSREVTVAQ